jgi:hypothetical protein
MMLAPGAADVFENFLGGRSTASGFLPYLHAMAATMSQKSSFVQCILFVQQAVMPHTHMLPPPSE